MTVPKFRLVFQLATTFFCIWHKHPDVYLRLDNWLTIFFPSSSSLFLPQSPLHSINIACVHLTLAPFWRSLAFFLQRINPLCSPYLPLFFFFFLILRRHSSDLIQSALTQLSDAQPNGPGRFEVGLVLTAGFTPFHQVFVLSKLYKKDLVQIKKKNHDSSFTEIFIYNPMINTSHCSPHVHLTVEILWTV